MNMTNNDNIRFSLRDVLFMAFHKRHVLLVTLLTVLALTMLIAFLVPPIYEATATVLVKPFIDPNLLLETTAPMRVQPVTAEDVNSEIQILQSDEVLRRVVKELKLDEGRLPDNLLARAIKIMIKAVKATMVVLGLSEPVDPVDAAVISLGEDLTVEPVTMSDMISVSILGDDPEMAAKIINTVVNSYIDHHIEVHKAVGGEAFYSKQATLFGDQLKQAEDELNAFQTQWSIVEIQGQQAANLELIRILRETLGQLRGKLAELGIKVQSLDKNMANPKEVQAMTEELRESPTLVELTKAIIPMIVEKYRIAQLYPKNSVEYKDTAKQVASFEKEIDTYRRQVLAGMQYDQSALLEHEKTISAQIEQVQNENRTLTENMTQFTRLKRNVQQLEKNYLLYKDKTEEARITERKNEERVANVAVASWAFTPSVPYFPKKFLMLLAAIVIGVITGIGASFAAYYLDHTIKRPEDLDRICEIPVIAVLSEVKRQ